MSETAKWYVIHTYSGYENKVARSIETVVENQSLQDLIAKVTVPNETVLETKDGKQREVERKVFPGYVLVKMILTDDSWYVIRNIRGVTGFVGPASKPIPLTEREVKALNLDVQGESSVRIEVTYSVGDSVRIISGSLEGITGTVDNIDLENNVVTVTVSMLGRDSQLELELGQVTTV